MYSPAPSASLLLLSGLHLSIYVLGRWGGRYPQEGWVAWHEAAVMLPSAASGCKNMGDALAEGVIDASDGVWDIHPQLEVLHEPQRVKGWLRP